MSPFANKTYNALLSEILSRISGTLDKREGSLIYNGIAPTTAELAQLYRGLDFVFTATYISTAPREYLIARAKDRGLSPMPASAAVFGAEFNVEVPINTRFSNGTYNFRITEQTSSDTEHLNYKVICETAGAAANSCSGSLVPIDYVAGLTYSELTDLLVPGADEEDTEVFRARVLESVKGQAFGGNQADYKAKCVGLEVNGEFVEAVKVVPVWNADVNPSELVPNAAVQSWYDANIDSIEDADAKAWLTSVYTSALAHKLTVGGAVRLIIMARNGAVPSSDLIQGVQSIIDPVQNAGEGLGLAPIGHVVTVSGVGKTYITIQTSITLATGYSVADVQANVNSAVAGYFNDLADVWADSTALTVRIAQLESRILTECANCITDIFDTTLNGSAANKTLDADKIPALVGSVIINV